VSTDKFQLIDFSEYKSGKKVLKARKGKSKLPPVNAIMMQATSDDWSTFEWWVSDERFLLTKHGKVVQLTNLAALIAALAEDDPELQYLAIEALEELMNVHQLDEDAEDE